MDWGMFSVSTGTEDIPSIISRRTASNQLIESLHRMPAILQPNQYQTWLDRKVTDPALLMSLLKPYPAHLMQMWPVSPLVNSVTWRSHSHCAPMR